MRKLIICMEIVKNIPFLQRFNFLTSFYLVLVRISDNIVLIFKWVGSNAKMIWRERGSE